MVALYCIGGLLLFLVLLLSSPLSVRCFYRETLQVTLRVWGIPVRLLPRPQVQQRTNKTASEETVKKPSLLTQLRDTFEQDGVAATLQWLSQLAGLLSKTVGKLLDAVLVKTLQLEMRVSGEDASAVALHYGEFCAAFYPMYALVSTRLDIRKQHIDLRPDFAQEGAAVLLDITARISLWRLLYAALFCGFSLLRMNFKTDVNGRKRKDGTDYGREQ